MSNFTLDSFAVHLTRTFSRVCAPGESPRAVVDTDEKGRSVLDFYLPNPHDPRRSVSLTASSYRGSVTMCSLWFGQVEIAAALKPEDAVPAIEEILAGNIVAIARYKTRDAYDDRRKGSGMPGAGRSEWIYQLPDDAEELDKMLRRLRTSASLWDKVSGTMTGVFEVYRWESAEVFQR